ncbi:DUF402 domain-containing protein [Streptomyces sp. FIT100]|uniref:DUF402 domain-containing protein n=1 Tax=Streptomyces sp. FIT100 TaxID=2837956 RepID=UPI0021C816CA|nr:DUF402 domain-containing protein [Streptomyces sp. FIT100]UUN26022.1 DUF402 domain-containing protein [Streptomyces sp. FIT100]
MSASSAERGRRVDVVLVKAGRTKILPHSPSGVGGTPTPAYVVRDDGTRITVRAPWAGEGVRDFGFVRFEPGDVFTEHYWRDRWYAVKEVRAGDGSLKGSYCDITRPASVHGSEVVVEDLDLDLWVSGDGTEILRLDEDEFAASGLARTDPRAAEEAERALDALELLARAGRFSALLA